MPATKKEKEEIKQEVKEEVKKEVEEDLRKKLGLKAKTQVSRFKEEFNKSINTAIVAAFGFLVALVWRDVITEWVDKLTALSPLQGKLISAMLVTLIATLGILIVSAIFSKEK